MMAPFTNQTFRDKFILHIGMQLIGIVILGAENLNIFEDFAMSRLVQCIEIDRQQENGYYYHTETISSYAVVIYPCDYQAI